MRKENKRKLNNPTKTLMIYVEKKKTKKLMILLHHITSMTSNLCRRYINQFFGKMLVRLPSE